MSAIKRGLTVDSASRCRIAAGCSTPQGRKFRYLPLFLKTDHALQPCANFPFPFEPLRPVLRPGEATQARQVNKRNINKRLNNNFKTAPRCRSDRLITTTYVTVSSLQNGCAVDLPIRSAPTDSSSWRWQLERPQLPQHAQLLEHKSFILQSQNRRQR